MKRSVAPALLGLALSATPRAVGKISIKSGATEAFLGDSITQYGKANPGG